MSTTGFDYGVAQIVRGAHNRRHERVIAQPCAWPDGRLRWAQALVLSAYGVVMTIGNQDRTLFGRFALLAVALAAILNVGAAEAGKKDDTLVWATDRDNPIADPFYLNTRELVVIGHHVWDTLVIIDPKTTEIKQIGRAHV